MAFRNITYYGEVSALDQVEQNIIWYLNDKLLQAGAYYNITSGFVNYNGEDISRLRPAHVPGFSNGSVWIGNTRRWVWSTGVVDINAYYITATPLEVSGVYVNHEFYPLDTTGTYAHYIDYNRGAVVFNTPIATSSHVYCERTERAAFVYSANSSEYRNFNTEARRYLSFTPGSGLDSYQYKNLSDLPAIFIETSKSTSRAYQLGSLLNMTNFNINMHIFAEDVSDFNVLRDICMGLEGHPVEMFDVNLAASGYYPLDYLGRLRGSYKTRDQLLNLVPWKTNGKFLNNSSERKYANILPIHRSTISTNFEILL